jgi:hypothetical protein
MDRKSPVDWCCAALLILLVILLASCAPQSEKPDKTYPLGGIVAFISSPDVVIGHIAAHNGCHNNWRLDIRMQSTGEIKTVELHEVVVISERTRSQRDR